jgi:hypothetical protein
VEKLLRVLSQKPLNERKCHARLTREYTDGGANICAENEFDAPDNSNCHFTLGDAFFSSSAWLSIPPSVYSRVRRMK